MKKKKPIFNKGNKIRNIHVDVKSHLIILASLLIVFNLFLVACAISLAVFINRWYVWLIDILLVLLCLLKSIFTYLNGAKNFCYAIYENCIYLDSIWYDKTIIEYKLIKNIKFKVGFLDKMFGKKTHTLIILLNDELQTKINLYLIKESPENLIEEISKNSSIMFKQKSAQNKTTENKTINNKVENKTIENKTTENKINENKTENHTVENKITQGKMIEHKTIKGKKAAGNKATK